MKQKALIFLSVFFFFLFAFLQPNKIVLADISVDAANQREADLKNQLASVEQEIAQQQAILTQKQGESASLSRDIAILNAKIAEETLNIKAKNLLIASLGKDIVTKTAHINDLQDQIAKGKLTLASLIRASNQLENFSLIEAILSGSELSTFFIDVDNYQTINKSIEDLFVQIRDDETQTQSEKKVLTTRQNAETDARKAIETEKANIAKNEADKAQLLSITKNQEKLYAQIVADKKAKAAQIRSALFSLRDANAIPFGTALGYALVAQKQTGIRPAFLLAILTQESNLGKNVGTCNRAGDPTSKSWKNIMPGPGSKSSRDDQSAFLRITSALGFDPNTMPLSCPITKNGWGGAMGPAQFIPTTWESFSDKIEKALGVSVANPWDPQHAFMASSLYLSNLGASAGGFTAERTAALKYYAGGNWYKSANAFYGDQVMAKAQNIQVNMIDPLNNY